MTEERLPLAAVLSKSGEVDFLRSVAEPGLQLLMEVDVEGLIDSARHEYTGERLNSHKGFHERTLDTRMSTLALRIPKLRQPTNSFHHVDGRAPRLPRQNPRAYRVEFTRKHRRRASH